MFDKLFENAALVLVVVPNGEQSAQIASAFANSLSRSQQSNQSVDAETVAVITAAISKVVDQPFKIKKIQFINEPGETAWSRIGRLYATESHNISPKNF